MGPLLRPAGHAHRRPTRVALLRNAARHQALERRRAFGLDREIIEQHEHRQLADCVDPKGRVHRFVVYKRGEPVSGGAMTFFPALGFAMLRRFINVQYLVCNHQESCRDSAQRCQVPRQPSFACSVKSSIVSRVARTVVVQISGSSAGQGKVVQISGTSSRARRHCPDIR